MGERESMIFYRILRESVKNYEKAFRKFVNKLIEKFGDQVTIILFGSRAGGRARESSDYDVAVIVRDNVDRISLLEDVSKLREDPVPIDIVVIKISELDLEIVKKMLNESKIIWNGLGIILSNEK